jgi:general secretion pathway protein G
MKKGFTLIEMTVVLLIIGILAGIVLRNIGGQAIQARDAKRVSDLRILANYLAQYMSKVGQFPTSSAAAASTNWTPLNNAFRNVGINVNLPTPPTGEAYVYYPCCDMPGCNPSSLANHFVLRARLEQTQAQAPRVYEGTYNSQTPPAAGPTGVWTCTAPSGFPFDCRADQRYYCLTQ